jgi:hypothetical protein
MFTIFIADALMLIILTVIILSTIEESCNFKYFYSFESIYTLL